MKKKGKTFSERISELQIARDEVQLECLKLDREERKAQYKRNAEKHGLEIQLMKKQLGKRNNPFI